MIPLEATIAKTKAENSRIFGGVFLFRKNKKASRSRSASNGMKRKAFGLIGIFLVIFQLFSPWMVNINNNKISIQANTASAASTRGNVDVKNSNAFLIITGITDNKSIDVSLFTNADSKINIIYQLQTANIKCNFATWCKYKKLSL
jgi:hypothetical protein